MRDEPSPTVWPVLEAKLAAHGYQRRAGWVFCRELDEGVFGWLSVSPITGPRREQWISPVVGVLHAKVEAFVDELSDQPPRRGRVATIARSLGYLMPQPAYEPWTIAKTEDPEPGARSLVAAIEEYGSPFMTRHASLPGIVQGTRAKLAYPPEQCSERLAAALYLSGDQAEALAEAQTFMDTLTGREDDAAQRYRDFAHALQNRIGTT